MTPRKNRRGELTRTAIIELIIAAILFLILITIIVIKVGRLFSN